MKGNCLLFIGILIVPIISGKYIPCHGDEESHLCLYDARCIPSSKRCDGVIDCDDKTDEEFCEFITCTGDEWFKCHDGECITSSFVCDGQFDCTDRSDESQSCQSSVSLNNKHSHCEEGDFHCHDGLCIPSEWTCDKAHDCLDGSDEFVENCAGSNRPIIGKNASKIENTDVQNRNVSSDTNCEGYLCKNGECILNRWVCDGAYDCADASDEGDVCNEKTIAEIECDPFKGHFYCKDSNECIIASNVCDGHVDCSNAYDEGNFCSEQNANCTDLNCSHDCLKHPENGPTCYCEDGFELHGTSDCHDINECKEYGKCSQICYNTPGSYKCSCKEGYHLVSGSCVPIENSPVLIFSTKDEVRVKNLNNNKYSLAASHLSHSTVGETTHAVGVSFDPLESRVYWSDFELEKERIVSADINGEDKRNVITSGLSVPEDLAVDYIGRNLYFTDGGRKDIVVCHISGAFCSVLLKDGIDKPRAIALHHNKGLLFYSDWGSTPKIVRAGMDGSQPIAIVTESIQWANGVAVDVALDRVFWSDAKYSWIESTKLDGSDRQRVVEDHIIHPFSVGVFGDFIYWSDWHNKVIQSCNKYNGKSHRYIVKESNLVPLGIHISHPLVEKVEHNPCLPKKCSHICLLTPSSGFACACPENMNLGDDKRTCIKKDNHDEFALVLSDGNTLSIMRPHNLGRMVDQKLNFGGISKISSITYNPVDHFLYIGSKASRMIYQVNFRKKIAQEIATGYPNDLAYDIYSNNLYWTDGDTNSIQVKDISSGVSTILISNLNHPVALDILQNKKLLVFSETKGNPTVKVSSLSGTNINELPNLERLMKHPMAITVHDKVTSKSSVTYIFIMDSYKNHIIQYDFDQRKPSILQGKLASPTSILSVGGKILWTEIHGLTLYWKGKNEVKHKSLDSLVNNPHPFLRLASVTPSKLLPKFDKLSAPCRINNGGCSDLCFSGQFSERVCLCPEGKVPLPGNSSLCYSECSDSLFHCGNGECIPHRWKCDGIAECSNKMDESDCPSVVTCEGTNFQCIKSKDCVPKLWVCDGFKDCEDGSDEHQCQKIDCGQHKTLCDDKSTCVLDLWKCDGYPDCLDGSDELRCMSVEDTAFPPTSSNETLDNRIQKDLKGWKELDKHFSGSKYSATTLIDEETSDSSDWVIVLIVVFTILSFVMIIGFILLRWKNCQFDRSQDNDITLRFRNPTFGLDRSSSFKKEKSKPLKEMSVMNQGDNRTFNAYGNPRYDKADSSNNIYSELDSGDMVSGAAITMEENHPDFYSRDDMIYNGAIPHAYEVDEDFDEESDLTSSLSYASTKDNINLLGKN
uniref:EGF-like domain-containing protein n=1 Tax=Lepeophtheirus salmonis TaxID=72036 RepID=A0A0K2U8P7_LEPSM